MQKTAPFSTLKKLAKTIAFAMLLCCFLPTSAFAQLQNQTSGWIDPKENVAIDYDPVTGFYLFSHIEGNKKSKPFKILNAEEFRAYKLQNAVRNAWIEKRDASKSQAQQQNNSIIPTARINNKTFSKIFGGNQININPQGTAEAVFRVNRNTTNNPLVDEQYRTNTDFDIDTKLQLNVNGSIGNRVKMNFNYNTDATFDFENQFKLTYKGNEDDILQRIDVGNINFPLSGTLISGTQGLFGVRTDLKFGRLTFSGLIAQQESESQTLEIKSGSQINQFEVYADEYDANRHFFLSHVFRDNYDKALRNMPYIVSGINITKVEVWITNKTSDFSNSRSLAAFIDLGEPQMLYRPALRKPTPPRYAANDANNLLTTINVANIRDIANLNSVLSAASMVSGSDYEKLENARKLIEGVDYTLNSQLGFISLNGSLNNDEVLAVAYEYTANGVSYKVGEMSTDGIVSPNVLAVKLLRGTNFTPKLPTWQLMMKNIYSISGTQFTNDEFYLDVYYQNDAAGTSLTYLSESAIKEIPLIRVLNADNLNTNNDAHPDGLYDFVEGVTVLASRGKIIFPALEPFGSYLRGKINNAAIADKYVYQELYDSTLVKAKEFAEKNKFKIAGSFKSSNSSTIMLNASNIPQGSVIVTVGGVKLTENVDYTVNYTMGTVQIINSAYLQSGMTLKISLEDNSLYSQKQKTMYGAHLNYEFNKDFNVGATFLGLYERSATRKISYGEDPVSNKMFGLNLSYRHDAPFLTKLVNKLPFIQTNEPSSVTLDAEYAKLVAGQSSKNSYIDDFESTRAALDLRSFSSWALASVPQGQTDIFPEGSLNNNIASGFNRAKFAWYSISTDFQRNTSYTPAYIKSNPAYRQNHFVREIPITEIYPDRDVTSGSYNYISTLDMAFYPNERGAYNYDVSNLNPDGLFTNPDKRWGGIMRSLNITDFETANYDHIEFWVMDPFVYNTNSTGGELYFNLGNVSEDVLRDGVKSFEHGIPFPYDPTKIQETAWGRAPTTQSLVNTFNNDTDARAAQDVGFDGLNDDDEATFFENKYSFISSISALNPTASAKLKKDPSSDDFKHYLDEEYNAVQAPILERYKDFNGTDGNSQLQDANRMSKTTPDIEDLNNDNTMNETESYFQYRIKLSPANMVVGQNYISDIREAEVDFPNNGGRSKVRWYQFKIPLNEYQKTVGDIADFKSIRFMRMFLRGFTDTTYLRFASLELVRSEWRTYNYSFIDGQAQPSAPTANLELSAVNLEENSTRSPVNYVLPPGVEREVNYNSYEATEQNEQSMEMRVTDLTDGESRAAYKLSMLDFRQFRRIKMDVHAEAVQNNVLNDGDVCLFVRFGSDFYNNYYEYEIPLSITPPRSTYSNSNAADREAVWPSANRLDVAKELFTNLKIERNQYIKQYGGSTSALYEKADGSNTIRVRGNPNLGAVQTMMIGVRNPRRKMNDDGLDKSVDVWLDEYRLSDYENEGGWAATARASAQLADLGNVTVSGTIVKAGFGSLEQSYENRAQEDTHEYSVVSNFELGKFFPQKWGVKIPFFFGYSAHYETPLYNPFDQDIKLKDALDALSGADRDSLSYMAKTYVQQKSFTISNMRIAPLSHKTQQVFDIANFSFSYAYNKQFKRSARIDGNLQENYSGILSYAYNVQPKYWQPFKKLKGSWLKFFRELNLNPYPNQFAFSTEIKRYYSEIATRNVTAPEVSIPTTYSKDFTWERRYALVYDITRNLRMDFNATNIARIDEPDGMVNSDRDPDGYRHWRDSVWSSFKNFGRNVQYDHTLSFTWQVPFNRIGILNWLNSQATYRAGYEWVAANQLNTSDYDPGNVISNTQTIEVMGTASFDRLYNKFPLLRKINDEFAGRGKRQMKDVTYENRRVNIVAKRRRIITHKLGTTEGIKVLVYDADGKEIKGRVEVMDKNRVGVVFDEAYKNARVVVMGKVAKPQNPVNYTAKWLAHLLMSLKTVNLSYTQQGATTLPGFRGKSKILGMSNFNGSLSPGWNFILGGQSSDFIETARNHGWLTTDTLFQEPYLMSTIRNLTLRARLEPIRDLNIDINMQRQKTNSNVYYNVVDANGMKQETGNFSVTVISIGSAFEHPTPQNGYKSKAYEKFLSNRNEIAWNLARKRAAQSQNGYTPGTGVYPNGYGEFSQEVLVNSFLSAYTGKSKSGKFRDFMNFPMPNWTISYTGLSRIAGLKRFLKSAILQHSYRSIYYINSFTSNQLYSPEADGLSYVKNSLGDFVPNRELTNVSLREAMNPLIKVDLSFTNMLLANFEIVRTRTVALSLSNNQITEARSRQYVIGAGYMFDNLPLLFRLEPFTKGKPKSTLRLKGDFSFREDMSIIRKLDETDIYSQIGDGRKIVSFTATADYAIGNSLNFRLFYERQLNEPYVSSIKTTNSSLGFSIRVGFGN